MLPGMLVTHRDHPGQVLHLNRMIGPPRGLAGLREEPTLYELVTPAGEWVTTRVYPEPLPPCTGCIPGSGYGRSCDPECSTGHAARAAGPLGVPR